MAKVAKKKHGVLHVFLKNVQPLKTAAIITIRQPGTMTPKGRRQVASWMRRQAKFLETHGKKMATVFTARYYYR